MREVIAVGCLLALAAGLAWLRPLPDRAAPAPMPASACTTWMADAIPGVGPKSREGVAAGIRSGSIPDKVRDWYSH